MVFLLLVPTYADSLLRLSVGECFCKSCRFCEDLSSEKVMVVTFLVLVMTYCAMLVPDYRYTNPLHAAGKQFQYELQMFISTSAVKEQEIQHQEIYHLFKSSYHHFYSSQSDPHLTKSTYKDTYVQTGNNSAVVCSITHSLSSSHA